MEVSVVLMCSCDVKGLVICAASPVCAVKTRPDVLGTIRATVVTGAQPIQKLANRLFVDDLPANLTLI